VQTKDQAENWSLAQLAGETEMLMGRFSKAFGEYPKSAQWQHFEIVHDGIHEIEGEIFLALLDVPEMELFTTDSRSDGGLRFPAPHSQFRDRQSKDFPWRAGSSCVVRTDRFGHIVIVAVTFILK
jgi:hypothetical protein